MPIAPTFPSLGSPAWMAARSDLPNLFVVDAASNAIVSGPHAQIQDAIADADVRLATAPNGTREQPYFVIAELDARIVLQRAAPHAILPYVQFRQRGATR